MNKFIPNNYKYRKIHKRVRIKKRKNFNTQQLKFGTFGLKILENGTISSTVFEAMRRSISFKLGRAGKLYINGFPNIPITSKPVGTRMGKGVGNISGWVYPVQKGHVLFELANVSKDSAKLAFHAASHKLALKSKFILK